MIYIHIGFHRTGSTFLQKKIFPFFKNIEFGHDVLFKKKYKKNILFSSETLTSGMTKNLNWKLMCNKLYKHYPKATIIIVIRNKEFLKRSIYKYLVKNSNYFKSYSHFLKENQIFINKKLEYIKICKYYKKKFGRENIKILCYERIFKNKKNLRKEIIDIFGECPPFTMEKINYSFNSKYELYFKRILNFLKSLKIFLKNLKSI